MAFDRHEHCFEGEQRLKKRRGKEKGQLVSMHTEVNLRIVVDRHVDFLLGLRRATVV